MEEYTGYGKWESQDAALCSSEYSDISPLTGGEVPFSTLEGRPDASNFEQSPVLQVNTCMLANRNCLDQFRGIPWNQTWDVHQGSTLIM